MSGNHLSHVAHSMHHLKHAMDEGGAKGALAGAAATAIGISAGLAIAGLALTPVGWVTAASIGAGLGSGALKKVLG